jgi:GDP/UDP-N,N'-diacetylbacillosamine 2-epimerase (hydrolysing)
MKNILVITGSRGEWGYLRPVLEKWKKHPKISFDLLATNMHLLSTHGKTYREIEADGFEIKYKINMAMASDDYFSHAKG